MNNDVVDIDWKYVAGLFDGEGSISIRDYPKTKCRGITIMILSQSEGNKGEVLANLVNEFLKKENILRARHYIYNGKDKRGYNHQPCHILVIENKWDAKIFLEKIKDYCIVKREQVIRALEFIKTLKKHTRPFSEMEKQQIKELYLSGVPQKEIAKKMNCGVCKIWKTLKKMNISPPKGTNEWRDMIRRTRRKKFSDEELLELYRKGYSISYIAKKLSVQPSSVRDRIETLKSLGKIY
jgi:transposase-like protein